MTMTAERNMSLEDALADAEARYVAANPRSRARHAEAAGALPGGNTRSILFYPPFPVTMARGEGARLWDLDGHEYLDFLGEYTAGLYGHSDPVIRAAVEQALADGILLGRRNRYEAELAALMCRALPLLRPGPLLQLRHRGQPERALGRPGRDRPQPHPGVRGRLSRRHAVVRRRALAMSIPFPYVFARYNDLEGTLALIEEHAQELAAIIVEPMMGAGGCIAAEPEFLRGLRGKPRATGIILDLRRGHDLAPVAGRPAGGARHHSRHDHVRQVSGRRHELWRVRRPARDHGPLRPQPAGCLAPLGHLQQQRPDHGRGRRRSRQGVHARGGRRADRAGRALQGEAERDRRSAARAGAGDRGRLDPLHALPARGDPAAGRHAAHAAGGAGAVPPRDALPRLLCRQARLHRAVVAAHRRRLRRLRGRVRGLPWRLRAKAGRLVTSTA